MKQLILKLLILSVAWIACVNYSYANTIHMECAEVTIHYKMGDVQLTPISKHFAGIAGAKWTGEDILWGALDDLGLDEFAKLSLFLNGGKIAPASQFSLNQLKHSNILVRYYPAENTPDKTQQRRIDWLADQINESVGYKAEVKTFVENNYVDESGNLRSVRDLCALWDKR
jgi:hypothetical protein